MLTSNCLKRMRHLVAVAAATVALGAVGAHAQDYKLGVSAMLTGPISSLYAAQAEGIRVFFDAVNANGGINGHRVSVTFRDNRGDPSVAASDAQAFVDGDVLGASLLSASNTVPGFAQVATRAALPVVNASWCYGPSVPGGGPKIADSYFCAGFSPLGDVYAIDALFTKFAERLGKGAQPGFAGTDAPGNVVGFKKALIPLVEHHGWKTGGYLAAVPFSTTDYTPAARALISSGAKAIVVWCPADCALQFIRALRSSGFNGPLAAVLASSEPEFRALKDPELYLILHNSLISEGKPVHKKIAEAAKRFNARAPANDLLGGWYVGMAYAKGLKECGFPCTREKLVKIFNANFTLDDADAVDLVSGKLTWNAKVHSLKDKSFQVVHWDNAKGDFVRYGKTLDVEDPGLVFPKF
jgi:ABC-type branched-subunit amino acid transport system substrate-binding protein